MEIRRNTLREIELYIRLDENEVLQFLDFLTYAKMVSEDTGNISFIAMTTKQQQIVEMLKLSLEENNAKATCD